jgi:hypothetical protein
VPAKPIFSEMKVARRSHRRRARLAAVVIAIGASIGAGGIGQAVAQAANEPEVQIGEGRSIERPAPPTTVVGDVNDVAGVAVAGIAIARSAPPVARHVAPQAPDASPFAVVVVGTCGAITLSAALWQLTRRRRHALL